MAAGEDPSDDVCVSSTTSGQQKSQKKDVRPENSNEESYADYLCPICLQILIEPVVMPCKHELCKPCFKKNVEEANLQCPVCRIRISSWARKQARNGTLVDRKRWEQIQRIFPERCAKRLRGEDDDDGHPPTKRVLSNAGEVYREYEFEMNKIRQAREEEIRASEEIIHSLEEEESKLIKKAEEQSKQDEDLAKRIQQEERQQHVNNSQEQWESASGNSTGMGKNSKSKKTTSKQGHSNTRTLDRWFSPTGNSTESARRTAESPSNTTSTAEDFLSVCGRRVKEFQEKQSQEKSDRELAMELQRQFDLEARRQHEVERKRGTEDAYGLRSEYNVQSK